MSTRELNDSIRAEVSTWLKDQGGVLVKEALQQYSRDLLQDIEFANQAQQEAVWEAINSIRKQVSTWSKNQGGMSVQEALQQYSRDLLQDIEFANRVQQEAVWEAIHKLRQPVDQEQQMAKVPSMVEAPSVRDLDDTVLDEVLTCTKQVALLEQRLVGMEQELRRVQEAAESCGLAMQNNVEHVRTSVERLSQLEVDRDDIQAARVSLKQGQETMRKVVVSDLVRLAKDKVRTKEDLGTYHWAKALDVDTGNTSKESSSAESDSDTSDGMVCALPAETSHAKIVAMRSSDSYTLQLSVWDAVIFLGVDVLYWHEELFLIVAYLINFILQSVFCLMVVHLGSEGEVMDDDALKGLEIWLKEAELWEVSAVCGSSIDYSQSSSYLQMELMDQARGYFEEAVFGISWGPLLTSMVIALWSGTMVRQATSLFDMTVALSELTVWRWDEMRTQFEMNLKNVEIISLTIWKFLLMILTVVLQLCVVFVLLVYGCLWMAQSSSVNEVLLNAVSLAFITDTDELIFATILPNVVRNMVKLTEPLSLKPRTSLPHLRSVVSLFTIIMFSTLFSAFSVRNTSTRMDQISLILCDGL